MANLSQIDGAGGQWPTMKGNPRVDSRQKRLKKRKQYLFPDEFAQIANGPWTRASRYYQCPACLRKKSEIVRPDENGQLIAHLVVHHDHFMDYVHDQFNEKINDNDYPNLRKDAKHLDKMCDFVRDFEDELICEDCNNADTRAKSIANTDKYFSFSVMDIRRITIVKNNNNKPVICSDTCRGIYKDKEFMFQTRKKFVARCIDLILKGQMWGERTIVQTRIDDEIGELPCRSTGERSRDRLNKIYRHMVRGGDVSLGGYR